MTSMREEQIAAAGNIAPEKTPLMIGPDILIKGDVFYEGKDAQSRLLVMGKVHGNIHTSGVLQIAQGAEVVPGSILDCGEIVVAGKICGEGVTIKTNLLILEATGNIAVDTLCLPPGGLEQARGGVLNARLDMSDAHIRRDTPALHVVDSSPAKMVETKPQASSTGHAHIFGKPEKAASAVDASLLSGATFGTSSGYVYGDIDLPGADDTKPASSSANG